MGSSTAHTLVRQRVRGLVACFGLTLIAGLLYSAEGDPFEISLWPGEGRPVLRAQSEQLQLRESPSLSASGSETVKTILNGLLTFDDSRYKTVSVGRIRAISAVKIDGRLIGPVTRLSRGDYYGRHEHTALDLKPGTEFDYLQYRAEGSCFIRIGGNVIEAEPCPAQSPEFRLLRVPAVEWWVHVSVGSSSGWVLVGAGTVRVTDREF